jgi:hypothetical protein
MAVERSGRKTMNGLTNSEATWARGALVALARSGVEATTERWRRTTADGGRAMTNSGKLREISETQRILGENSAENSMAKAKADEGATGTAF